MSAHQTATRRNPYKAKEVAAPHAKALREIQDLYEKLAHAVLKKELVHIAQAITSDGHSIGFNGEHFERDAWLADIEGDLASVKHFDKVEYSVDKLTVHGSDAVVYLTERFSGMRTDDPRTPEKEPERHFSSTVLSRDVLVHTPSGWKIRESETIKSELTAKGATHTSAHHTRST